MAYGAGQEHWVEGEGKQSPTEKYKSMLMDRLADTIRLDVAMEDEGYCRSVDSLFQLLRLYSLYREHIINKYKQVEVELDGKLKEVDAGEGKYKDMNDSMRDEARKRLKYDYAKSKFSLIIDMVNNSPIIEKDMEGLFFSPTSPAGYKEIRARILETKVSG